MPGHEPILLDLGTGARYFGEAWNHDEPFRGTCLLTHLHWDHVQGLPFFPPILRQAGHLDVHLPKLEDGRSVTSVIGEMLAPPLFPVGLDVFPGTVSFIEHDEGEFLIGEVMVTARLVPHLGNTFGYRLDWRGASVAYISDHQQPGVDVYEAPAGVRELCAGVDVLIHDAQYTRSEFQRKSTWGHCTVDFAAWLAGECDVDTLVLFHHDPTHDDDMLDRLVADADQRSPDVRVLGAREGCSLPVGR